MPTTDDIALAAALARPDNQPHAGFAALHALADRLIGVRMFTVLAFDFPRHVTPRLYSTNEEIYPTGAEDPIGDSIWEHTLVKLQQPLVLNDPQAMATLLPNVPQLTAIGCEAMLNLPVVMAGETVGALNMLAQSGHFTSERISRMNALAPAAIALILWHRQRH